MTGMWNIRTLIDLFKLEQACNQLKRYKMDMFGLSQIIWLDQDEHFTQDGSLSLVTSEINKLEDME